MLVFSIEDRFLDSKSLVHELLKSGKHCLQDVTYELVKQFKSIKIDKQKCYDFDVSACCRPIKNPEDETQTPKPKPKAKPTYIYFDSETYTSKTNKHIPYLVCVKDKHGCKAFESKYCLEEF